MAQTWGNKTGGSGDVLKIEAGKPKLVHIMSETPWEFRSAFHSVLKKAITIPVTHEKIEGERTRYGFIVFDFDEKKVKPWFVSKTLAAILHAAQVAWKGTFEKMDVLIDRKGTSFNDTEYTASPVPTMFENAMAIGASIPDMEKLTAISLPADITMHLNTPDPQLEARRLERETKDATAKQRKYLEDCIDRKKVNKSDFLKMLQAMDADPSEDGKFLPKKLTVAQAGNLIDMVKEF